MLFVLPNIIVTSDCYFIFYDFKTEFINDVLIKVPGELANLY